jgi:hypothetical protein
MATVTVVRYKTTPDQADENQRLVEAVFTELAEDQPEGLRYATLRLDDGVSFVHLAIVDGDENPLLTTTAFGAFVSAIGDRCVEGPAPREATVVGSYRLLPG